MLNRSGESPGIVVALIGSDGSGKSTVSRWLAEKLDEQFDTMFLYFGTGDGPGSLPIKTLNWLKDHSRYGKKSASQPVTNGNVSESGKPRKSGNVNGDSRAPGMLRVIWAVAAASDRKSKMRKLDRAARSGKIVITDRYPQSEYWGIHDGPRLGFILQENTRGLLHRIAQWEHSFYVRLAQRKPDLVILLNVATDIAHIRRPEESIDELTRRINIAQALTFQGARRVVLDSGESLPVVQSRALQAVLDALPPSYLSETSTQTLKESERAHKKVDC